MFDTIGNALLPVAVCPVCLSTYAALLSSLGVGFLSDAAYMFPLFVAGLALAVGALGVKARAHRNYGPFILGLVAVSIVLVLKFLFGWEAWAAYFGLVLLIAAALWNFWS